jgi:deoxyribonuclease IV
VPKNVEHVEEIGALAKELHFTLTVHAPFFINLNSTDESKLEASKKRILDSLTMAQIAGAKSVCVHAAFNGSNDPSKVLDNVRKATDQLLRHKNKFFPDVNLAYETMGKHSQWGTLEETLTIAKEFEIYPCVDVAHMHARANGAMNSTDEWNELLDTYVRFLGKKSLKQMHLHFSGIEYSDKGERKHLPIRESDAKWKEFLQVLAKREVGGVLVSESPLLEDDALFLQKEYQKFSN